MFEVQVRRDNSLKDKEAYDEEHVWETVKYIIDFKEAVQSFSNYVQNNRSYNYRLVDVILETR